MEHARPDLKAEMVATFADFPPWIHMSEVLISCVLVGILLCVAPLLLKLASFPLSPKKNPPEVPDGSGVWRVYKDALWVRYYYWIYEIYPRDICSYFWKSVMMVVASIMSVVSAPFVLVCIVSFVCWAIYGIGDGIWHIILAILHMVILLPEGIKWLFFGIVDGVLYIPYITRSPATWTTLGIAGVTVLFGFHIYLFFLSNVWKNAWRVTRLWMKAKKEKFCPRIRVLERTQDGVDHEP